MRACGSIPQTDSAVPTTTREGRTIRAERNVTGTACMPREECHFLISLGIIEPNTDRTCDRHARAV